MMKPEHTLITWLMAILPALTLLSTLTA